MPPDNNEDNKCDKASSGSGSGSAGSSSSSSYHSQKGEEEEEEGEALVLAIKINFCRVMIGFYSVLFYFIFNACVDFYLFSFIYYF